MRHYPIVIHSRGAHHSSKVNQKGRVIMAVALFQCLGEGEVADAAGQVKSAPVKVLRLWPFQQWFGITFEGPCDQMYVWCMDLIPKLSPGVAFIGIDTVLFTPDDPYRLILLTDLTCPSADGRLHEQKHMRILINAFTNAVAGLRMSHEEILTICQRCVLGDDVFKRAEYAANLVQGVMYRTAIETPEKLIDSWMTCYGCGMDTMVRVMAHFAYLVYKQCVKPSRIQQLLGRFG